MFHSYYILLRVLVESVLFIFLVFCVVFCVLFAFVLCLVCPMLPESLDCPFLIAPSVFSNVYLLSVFYELKLFSQTLNGRQ